jgi:hypothetical protein
VRLQFSELLCVLLLLSNVSSLWPAHTYKSASVLCVCVVIYWLVRCRMHGTDVFDLPTEARQSV